MCTVSKTRKREAGSVRLLSIDLALVLTGASGRADIACLGIRLTHIPNAFDALSEIIGADDPEHVARP